MHPIATGNEIAVNGDVVLLAVIETFDRNAFFVLLDFQASQLELCLTTTIQVGLSQVGNQIVLRKNRMHIPAA